MGCKRHLQLWQLDRKLKYSIGVKNTGAAH
jgi:hypothetical protein